MMKTKTILKVLSFVLILAMAVSAVLLTSCGNSKVEEDLQTTQDKLDAMITEFTAEKEKVKQLEEKLATLAEGSATKAELEAQLAQAKARLQKLENEYMVTANFQEATEYLFGHGEWSLDAFEAKIEQESYWYAPEDYEAYEAEAWDMYYKLIRVTSLADIQKAFADLEALFDAVPTLAERVEQQLDALEASGIAYYGYLKVPFQGRTVDQLDPLNHYLDYVESRDLFLSEDEEEAAADEDAEYKITPAQVERIDAIFAARDRLDDAEEEAQDAYAWAAEHGIGEGDVTLYTEGTKAKIDELGTRYAAIDAEYFDKEREIGEDEDGNVIVVDLTELYAITVEDLTGYANYAAHLARYKVLDNAYINFRDVVYGQLDQLPNFKTIDPHYTDYNDIETKDGAKIDDWVAKYALSRFVTIGEGEDAEEVDVEEENRRIIVNKVDEENTNKKLGGYDRVVKVRFFVNELNTYYTRDVLNTDVAGNGKNLAQQIKAEIQTGASKVLYTHCEVLGKAIKAANKVRNEVTALADNDGYQFPDAWRTMLGIDLEGDYNEVTKITARYNTLMTIATRVYALDQAISSDLYAAEVEREETSGLIPVDKLDTLSLAVEAWRCSFADSKRITKTVPAAIDAIFAEVYGQENFNIGHDADTDDANYEEITKTIFAHLNALKKVLENLFKEIQQIYDQIRDELRVVNPNYLTSLKRILWANSEFIRIQGDVNINDIDFDLVDDSKDENGELIEANGKIAYSEVLSRLNVKVIKLVNVAENADRAAASINEKIAALGTYNLNKTGAFDAAVADTIAWAERYLGFKQGDTDNDGELDEDDDENLIPESNGDYLARIAQYFAAANTDGSNGYILGIMDYNKQNPAITYTFIADFATLKAAEADRTRIYAEAEAAWANVNMKPNANNIALDASFTAFVNYVRSYYTAGNAAIAAQGADSKEELAAFYDLGAEAQVAELKFPADVEDTETYYFKETGRTVTKHGVTATYRTSWKAVYAENSTTQIERYDPTFTLVSVEDETLRQQADRFASYIVNQQIATYQSYDAQTGLYDEAEKTAYTDELKARDLQYTAIMTIAESLKAKVVPDYEGDEDALVNYAEYVGFNATFLKELIDNYRVRFGEWAMADLIVDGEPVIDPETEEPVQKWQLIAKYAGKFLFLDVDTADEDAALTDTVAAGDASIIYDAELIAYQAMAKALVADAIGTRAVKDEIVYLNRTYYLNNEEDRNTLTTLYCDNINAMITIKGVVESAYGIFLQTAFESADAAAEYAFAFNFQA